MVMTLIEAPTSLPVADDAFDALRDEVNGSVFLPMEPEYEAARRVWNAMIDKRPAVIVRPAGPADVQRAVNFARRQGLSVSVKGGGHNVAGHAVSNGGVMIDLSAMRAVRVDPEIRTAWVEGGATWADVDQATAPFGLAAPGGVISSTGVGGLTLGGGIGYLVGKYGMTIDNLRSLTFVTADGEIVTASATSHPDLFWAARGGGGNFGVAIEFEFALHPVDTVLTALVVYPLSAAREVLTFYRELAETAPEELTPYAGFIRDPESGERVVAILACWPGDLAEGERVLEPLMTFGEPLLRAIGPMPYVEWQRAFDEGYPYGTRHYYWKGSLLRSLPDDLLDVVAEFGRSPATPESGYFIEGYRGAMNRVAPAATAFPHRDAHYQIVIIGATDDPARNDAMIDWTRRAYAATEPFALNGAFLNFNAFERDERRDRVRAGYGANWDRLLAVKRRYDPTNLFRENNNIAVS